MHDLAAPPLSAHQLKHRVEQRRVAKGDGFDEVVTLQRYPTPAA